jgi:hypothetical protein
VQVNEGGHEGKATAVNDASGVSRSLKRRVVMRADDGAYQPILNEYRRGVFTKRLIYDMKVCEQCFHTTSVR